VPQRLDKLGKVLVWGSVYEKRVMRQTWQRGGRRSSGRRLSWTGGFENVDAIGRIFSL
jgi:hypothetical protein